jgi:1-acyl-sn-glycerol-3-phosphate acyltransferase
MNGAELAYCTGTSPSHLKGYMKKVFKYIPFVGWIGMLVGNIPLSRSWNKDKVVIANALTDRVINWPPPNHICLYPEGTRLTNQKLQAAQKFARDNGLVELRHLLQPRVKGFIYTLQQLRDLGYTYIIDITAVPTPRAMDFKELFMGKFHTTHAHVTVMKMKNLPESAEEIKIWLRNQWVQKDALIQARKDGLKWNGVEVPFLNHYYSSSALFSVHALLFYKVLSYFVPSFVAVTWVSWAAVCLFYVLMRSVNTAAIQNCPKLELKTE